MSDGTKNTSTSSAADKAEAAKDKVVKPQTEAKVKDAADSVSEAASKAAGTARETTAKAKQAAGNALSEAKAEAKTQLSEAKSTAKAKLDETKTRAQERAHEEAEARKAQATSALSTTVSDLRRASEAVEEGWMTKALSTAASSLDEFTQGLDEKSPAELQAVAQRTAREHPGLFLAGCFAAGVALTRTLKVAQDRAPERLYDGETRRSTDQSFGQGASRDATLTDDRQVGFDTDYASTSASPLGATGANSRAGASSLDRQ